MKRTTESRNKSPIRASLLLRYIRVKHKPHLTSLTLCRPNTNTANHLAERTKQAAGLPACDAAKTQLWQKNTALLSTLSFENQTAVHAVGSSRGQGTVRNITVVENKSQILVLTEEFVVDLGSVFVWGKQGPTLRTALLCVTAQLVVVIPCGRFGTTYRSHLQGSSLCNNPNERSSHLIRGGDLKSRTA